MSGAGRGKALVTGGTRGIGAAAAVALRDAGFAVVVTGTAPGGRGPDGCGYQAVDLSDAGQLSAFTREVGTAGFSVLVNNAGVNKVGRLEDYDPADLERILAINLTAPYRLCQAVLPGMRSERFGRIVNITSIFGMVSKEGRSAYSASKFGVLGMTRALALEVAADNVLVNCLAPGFVDTEMTRSVLGEAGIADMVKQVPMRRLARPEEIGNYVAFMCGSGNTFMTGQTIVVDGGFTCA